MITDGSTASPTGASSCPGAPEAPISVSRLGLDDPESSGTPPALADGHARPAPEHVPTLDDTDRPEGCLSGDADEDAVQDLHAQSTDKRTGQCSVVQSAVALSSSSQLPALATGINIFKGAVPGARMETTGMMASIPAPQGRHIRYDAESDSEGRLVQPCSPSAAAELSLNACSELNSVDQEALLNAVPGIVTPACKDLSSLGPGVVSDGCGVSDAVVAAAMQGVLATTVDAPAEVQEGDHASSTLAGIPDAHPDRQALSTTPVLAGVPDAPPDRQALSTPPVLAGVPDAPPDRQALSTTPSTLHSASSAAHAAADAGHCHTTSREDSHAPATPDLLAGSHAVDPADDDSQAQQHNGCSVLEASASLTAAFADAALEQRFGVV